MEALTQLQIANLNLAAAHPSPPHQHEAGQLFILQSGLISIYSERRRHLLPSACLAWVPPWVKHGAEVHQPVLAQRWYIEATWARRYLPATVKIIRVTDFLAQLMTQLSDLHQQADRAYQIYLHCLADQLQRQPGLGLSLAMPSQPRLLALCQYCITSPQHKLSLDQMAEMACMSRRSLSRHFLQQTGSNLGLWLQQMRLIHAMEKLAQGHSVTTIALELGYQSLSAFIKQFRRHLGVSPRVWQTQLNHSSHLT